MKEAMIRMKLLHYLCLVFMSFSAVFSVAQNSVARQEAISLMQEGDANLKILGWDAAMESYTNAINTDPTYAPAYIKRGQLYERTWRSREAAADYDKAIQLNPLIDIYYNHRARLKMLSFDYYGALDDLSQAISMNTSNRDYLKYQIDGFISLGRYEEALANLDTAKLDERDNEFTFQRKALIYLLNDDLLEAKAMTKKAYELNADAFLTLDLMGLISLKNQAYDEAISWFTSAIEADSTQSISYYNRGITYRLLGEPELALKDIDWSIQLNNKQQNDYVLQVLSKEKQSNLDGTLNDYKFESVGIDSSYANAVYNRSITYKILGDYQSAAEDIDFLIKVGTEKPEYWNIKGNLLVLHGDMLNAIEAYNKAISIDFAYSDAYYNKGIANLLLNRPLLACRDLQESIDKGNTRAQLIVTYFCGY